MCLINDCGPATTPAALLASGYSRPRSGVPGPLPRLMPTPAHGLLAGSRAGAAHATSARRTGDRRLGAPAAKPTLRYAKRLASISPPVAAPDGTNLRKA